MARKTFLYYAMLKSLPLALAKLVIKLRLLDWFTSYTKLTETTTQQYLDSITDNADLKAVLAYSFGDYGQLSLKLINFSRGCENVMLYHKFSKIYI